MTYLLLALAATVYLWPAGKAAPHPSTDYQAALTALSIVRSRLARTQSFSGSCQEAFRVLTMAHVEGADL